MQDLQQRLKTEIQRENQNAKTSFKRIGYQMSQFPNVEAMGLAISTADEISDAQRVGAPIHQDYVSGKALERLLESAPEVYGSNGLFGTEPDRDDKHIGKVVCIQTIKREPLADRYADSLGNEVIEMPFTSCKNAFLAGFQARDEQLKEFVGRMKELSQAMPPNAVSMEIYRALQKIRMRDESQDAK